MLNVDDVDGFEWDEGNQDKNWLKHQVSNSECEELFFNFPLMIADDLKHSKAEQRYYALGQTNGDSWLFIAFILRKKKIRVKCARDMSPNERKAYAKANP